MKRSYTDESGGTRIHTEPERDNGGTTVTAHDAPRERSQKPRRSSTWFSEANFIIDITSQEAFALGPGEYELSGEKLMRKISSGGASIWESVSNEQLETWRSGHWFDHLSTFFPEDYTITGSLKQPIGEAPLSVCTGQLWRLPEGLLLVHEIMVDEDSVVVRNEATRALYKISTMRLPREGRFISGPQTPEEEILYIAQKEIEDVPDGLDARRWTAIVASAREQIFLSYAAPAVAPQQLKEAISLVRKVVPLFTRPI